MSVISQSQGPFPIGLGTAHTSAFLPRRFVGGQWLKLREQPKAFARLHQRGLARLSHFVILARRTLRSLRYSLPLPLGHDEARVFQSPQGRIDRATRQPCNRHNVKAITVAMIEHL